MTVTVETLEGDAVQEALPALARLRIAVFRDFPYLYDGSEENEQHYLRSYIGNSSATLVVARDGSEIVGVATGMPLSAHGDASQLHGGEIAVEDTFYCAESVLLPEYRGQGIGHAFFDHREAVARKLGFGISAFCGVIRPADHPMRPAGYRALDAFWRKRGYEPCRDAIARFTWVDVGDSAETEKQLRFWQRKL